MTEPQSLNLHATAVSVNERAVILKGASGSGKSSLALQLIALGAELIADDQCTVFAKDSALWVKRPSSLPPLIEARGVGLLNAPLSQPCSVAFIVNMDSIATDRLPAEQFIEYFGFQATMIDKSDAAHFPSAVLLYLTHGIAT